jgi:hypothetical protein
MRAARASRLVSINRLSKLIHICTDRRNSLRPNKIEQTMHGCVRIFQTGGTWPLVKPNQALWELAPMFLYPNFILNSSNIYYQK